MIFLLFHVLFSTALAFLGATLFGNLTPLIAAVSITLACPLSNWSSQEILGAFPGLKWRSFTPGIPGKFEMFLFALLLLFATRQFAFLLTPSPTGIHTLNQNNLGDLPCHINYIRAMAGGAVFPIPNPEFASEPLRYPFGIDLYNALWESLGIPLPSHLFLTGILLSATSLVVLRWFGGWWTISAFFLGGGAAGALSSADALSVTSAIDWKNLFLSVFVTQRGVLIALPVGCLLLQAWRLHVSDRTPLDTRVQCILGVTLGLLPFFHAHTFVAVSLFLLLTSLQEQGVGGFRKLALSPFLATAFLPATYFVLSTSDRMQKAKIIGLEPFLQKNAAFPSLWSQLWSNFGLWLILPAALGFILFYSRKTPGKQTEMFRLVSLVLVFIVFLSINFAPWPWDNIKLLIWPYLLLAQLAGELLDPLSPFFVRLALFGGFSISGLTSLFNSFGPPSLIARELYKKTDLNDTEGALKNLPPDSVFIAAPDFNHALTYFGRFRVLGYEGHLFSHAVDYRRTAQKQQAIFTGDPRWRELVGELHASHIFWGPAERALFGNANREWMSELENVSLVPGVAVYRIK